MTRCFGASMKRRDSSVSPSAPSREWWIGADLGRSELAALCEYSHKAFGTGWTARQTAWIMNPAWGLVYVTRR